MGHQVIGMLGVRDEQHDPTSIGPIIAILRRHLDQRAGCRITENSSDYQLTLAVDPNRPPESYELVRTDHNGCSIRGGDRLGLLYGVGRFLREGICTDDGFIPGDWQGQDAPAMPVRGMYFATHFHNFYQESPAELITDYLHDLALWGCNTAQVWFDMHHYKGINDEAAQRMIEHLKAILRSAKQVGLRTCLIGLGNEAYADSPPELRADFNTGRAVYHCELCPSKPEAVELMLKWFEELLEAFDDVRPDIIGFGPYDQGGCACQACKPWGSNGYLRIVQAKVQAARRRWPQVRVLLSTWLFDYESDQGEWAGLAETFKGGVDWCDYIQADSHERFPRYPLEHGVPGNLPLLNFPEISMWMMHPWGGYGANPLPGRIESLWREVQHRIAGGFPYSEGIYEDINKVICLGLYWNPDANVQDIVRQYIGFEYGKEVIEPVLRAINMLESNHNHLWYMNWQLGKQIRLPVVFREDPAVVFDLLKQADQRMTQRLRAAWRWRILYLRGLIDHELQPYDGYWANAECEKAFDELIRIYHAQGAELKCSPPSRQAVARRYTTEHAVQ